MKNIEALAILVNAALGYEPSIHMVNKHYGKVVGKIYSDLEIINILESKKVDILGVSIYNSLDLYNFTYRRYEQFKLTQEEFDKIKQWLERKGDEIDG